MEPVWATTLPFHEKVVAVDRWSPLAVKIYRNNDVGAAKKKGWRRQVVALNRLSPIQGPLYSLSLSTSKLIVVSHHVSLLVSWHPPVIQVWHDLHFVEGLDR